MITKVTHVSVLVNDQDEALKFYVDTLGLEKRSDDPMPGSENQRWLTVGPKDQPDVEIILQATDWGVEPITTEERAALVGKAPGLLFQTNDIKADVEALKAKGV
ncbi:MAG: glyoxalase, partial [Chloroflexi bacterium]|nr:glyoxalase [Chloroflexota bacterium]